MKNAFLRVNIWMLPYLRELSWASFHTYHSIINISERSEQPACKQRTLCAQTCKSLRFSHAQSMDVNEDSGQNLPSNIIGYAAWVIKGGFNAYEINQTSYELAHIYRDITLIPPILFVLKLLSAFYICCILSRANYTALYHGSKHYAP